MKTFEGRYNPVSVDDMALKEIIGDQIPGLHNAYDGSFQKQVLSGLSAPSNESKRWNKVIIAMNVFDYQRFFHELFDERLHFLLYTDKL